MIQITQIKKLKGDKYLVEVDENTNTHTHILGENTIIKYGLLTNKSISTEEYKRIIKDNEYELLYLKAIHYIGYQMRTISEVKKHLRKDTKNEKLIDKIISELKSNKYVNDSIYTSEFIRDKMEYDLVGPSYIKEKLIQRGIHYDLIHQELLHYDDEKQYEKISMIIDKEIKYKLKKPYQKVYLNLKQKCVQKGFGINIVESCLQSRKDDIMEMIDEDELIQRELNKLLPLHNLDNRKEKDKLIKKLLQRGYNYDVIKEFLN